MEKDRISDEDRRAIHRGQIRDWARIMALRELVIELCARSTGATIEAAAALLAEREKVWQDRFLLDLENEDPGEAAHLDDPSPPGTPPAP